MASERKIVQFNNNLLNAITPEGGIEVFRNKIIVGENILKIYYIKKYPPSLRAGWASKLSNLPNTIFCQVFASYDNALLIMSLSKSVTRLNGVVDSTRDPLERQRAERESFDAQKVMEQIDNNEELIGFMANLIVVSGRDEEQLEKVCRRLESTVSALGCQVRLLTNLQKEAYLTISPYNVPNNEIFELAKRNVPMSTVQGGFPLTSNGFIDKEGYVLGLDTQNGLIAVDFWGKFDDRTNSNITVVGMSGSGKSALIKLIIIKELMLNTNCIIVDPQCEYIDMVLGLGGDVIRAGGGGFIINPLQIKTVPMDEGEDDMPDSDRVFRATGFKNAFDNVDKTSRLALHIQSLEIFFKLYLPEITSIQMALLKQLLEDLYASFGIVWSTDVSTFKNTDYPIFTDLYDLILKVKVEKALHNDETYKADFEYLELMVRELAHGSDQFMWNGHTSVESNSKIIVIDTEKLNVTATNVKRAQYYIILTWAWERMSRDRQEKVMLFCDEAYLLIDPEVPQSLVFMRNIEKQARKYEAGLCVITQSVVDFLDPRIKLHGQALLDTPTYKFIMGTDGQNIKDLIFLYGLTEKEQEKILSKVRGCAIFFVGSRRFLVNVKISEENLKRMGNAGGK